ncbi:MAG TPA: hypothetical protein VNM72_06020 [Blastocatellia bacterium]|nr:hypothetical protein [Blastocatellia bacterium]
MGVSDSCGGYVRHRPGYDYRHRAEVGSSQAAFVPDEIVDRYCIVGPIEEHLRRLRQLQALGVTRFDIYLTGGDEEQTGQNLRTRDHSRFCDRGHHVIVSGQRLCSRPRAADSTICATRHKAREKSPASLNCEGMTI